MKFDRFAAVLLIGLLTSDLSAAGRTPSKKFKYRIGKNHQVVKVEDKKEKTASGMLAQAIAKQVKQVDETFAKNRSTLRIVHGLGNASGYLPNEVTGLISDTHKDLDQAIQSVQPSGSEPLLAWVDDQFQQIQEKIPPPGPTASLPGSSAPRGVAMFASLRGFGLPMLAVAKPPKRAPAKPKPIPPKPKPAPPKAPQPPKPQTIPVATADRLLDQVAEVVRQIFVLADHDDLEVSLWVGSTPAQKAKFIFWSQGNFKGATPAPRIIKTDGQQDHVLRGLYFYEADLGIVKGAVTQKIKYDPTAPLATERLDLVKGSRFFCCQFKEAYCHHVENEKDCR
jgi:hypothetical protein